MDNSDSNIQRVRGVIYARYSSDNQSESSISAQLRAVMLYAEQNHIFVVDKFIDRAKSARHAEKRDAFQEMIKQASEGKFDVVLVHKLDRFARNNADTLKYISILSDYNVRVVSVSEAFDDSPSGSLVLSLLSSLAEFYSRNLAMEVNKGMKEVALKKGYTGGVVPFGYDVYDATDVKKFRINKKEAPAIRKIFEMFVSGSSYMDIVRYLNDMGFKTRQGNSFGKNSISSILQNPQYSGIYTYNKLVSARKSDGKRNGHAYKPLDEQIVIPAPELAIVSEELFAKAKERFELQKKHRPFSQSKYPFLLSGLIKCGLCGSSMSSNSYRNKSGTLSLSYRCSLKNNRRGCTAPEVRAKMIESLVLSELEKLLQSPSVIQEIADRTNAKAEALKSEYLASTKSIRDAITKEKAIQKRLVNAIAETGINPALQQRLAQTEEKLNSLNAELLRFDKVPDYSAVKISSGSIKAVLKDFRTVIESSDSKLIKKFISGFVKSVIVFPDHVEILFKLPMDSGLSDDTEYCVSKTKEEIILNYSCRSA